jgi:hypothetical protein
MYQTTQDIGNAQNRLPTWSAVCVLPSLTNKSLFAKDISQRRKGAEEDERRADNITVRGIKVLDRQHCIRA